MGKIFDILGDVLTWFINLFIRLERNRYDDPVIAQWKSYKRSMRNTLFLLVGYCLFSLAWIPDAPDTGNYSPITASAYQAAGIFLGVLGGVLIIWLSVSIVLFLLHCRRHDLPLM